MDPNPSESKAMAMVMDTNSEAWSTASSTIIDTQSEPPRCQGREADKIRMRATSAHEPTLPPLTSKSPRPAQPQPPSSSSPSVSSSAGGSLAAKLESNKQCRNSASSKASKSTSKSSKVAGHKSSKAGSKVPSVAATGNSNASGVRSKKPNASSSRSTTSSITASVATKEAIASKKKKSSVSAPKTSSAGSKQRSAGIKSGSHGHTSQISGASKTTKAKTEPSSQSNSNTRRNTRDPEETTARNTHPDKSSSHGHIESSNSNSHTSKPFSHALVPVPPPERPAPSNHRLLDPPSAGEYTSSTASSTAELIESYDPPSMIDSFGYTKSYPPKQQQDDETRNSRGSSRNRSSVEESMLTDDGLESRMMDTTLPTYSGEGESSRANSVSTSPASEGCSRIAEEEEEESYYSNEENSEGGRESGSEVERALAIREENHSEGTSTRGDDGEDENAEFKDSHALVQNDYYDGAVNSSYDEVREGDVAIVPGTNDASRYLSKAVDNHQAIVPMDSSVYEAYDHTFVTCPEHLRFRFLYTFLKKNLDKKVMIFFSTSNSAKFHAKLLGHFKVPTLTMHGKQSREKFISRFFKFSDWDTGILCATDAAGRDLDIPPSVDWVVQFEPPDDPSEYILRVARISCDSDRVGRSLLFLNPGEQGFLKYYHSASIPVSEFEIPKNKLADVQSHIEYHVNENERLLALSRDAYGSYLISYASHGFRDVYNVHDLNKSDVASAFGLVGLPSEADDMTLDTKTLAVSTYGDAGEGLPTKSGGGAGSSSKGRKAWQKEEKQQAKSWMRGEKSWPHSQIKMHPKFKE